MVARQAQAGEPPQCRIIARAGARDILICALLDLAGGMFAR
jgi:hypothetical protein